jgi:two-component system LytT family sensor kinase
MLIWIFFYFTIRSKPNPVFVSSLLVDVATGILFTHMMRAAINSLRLVHNALQKQIVYLFLTALIFSLLSSTTYVYTADVLKLLNDLKNYTFLNKVIRSASGTFSVFLIWNLIYFAYHYIDKTRQAQIDKIRLESLVKELELKTIKSHINPHFIFNALNSIRALVDENPGRARTAITELSNILRSSMQADKVEMAPFEKELNIVKDYLALEHIRFEDRLRVEYDIDEDTLDQPVPPMMLQTLAENAIKHGISKQVNGGLIRIVSSFREDCHELIVQNTGHLNKKINTDGFGIASTQNRLNLLYGIRAYFALKNVNDDIVEAKVSIPIHVG